MNTTSIINPSLGSTISSSTRNPVRAVVSSLVRTDHATAPVILRLALAAVILPHGAQKLLGCFGGYGFEGTMGFFTGTMGLHWLLALGVILIEFFAPLLLVLGLGTRLAAMGTTIVMASAMFMVHIHNGFFMNWFGAQKGEGIEYFLLAIGIGLALLVSGGGRWSVDRALGEA